MANIYLVHIENPFIADQTNDKQNNKTLKVFDNTDQPYVKDTRQT